METIASSVIVLFIITTFFTVWQFFNASGKSKAVLLGLILWMVLQTILSLTGFYQDNHSVPPRFVFSIGPGFIFIIILFLTKTGRRFIDSLDVKNLTLLHIARIPVEITLYFVFLAGLIPKIMTFEGSNYDIISGITAVAIYYLIFVRGKENKIILLVWNFLCLGLLINILVIAILSAQTPFQRFAFDQPNIGVTYFPFVWLPSVIVPLVLLAHVASIRQLINSIKKISHD